MTPSISEPRLSGEANRFAARIRRLLDATVTRGARISAATADDRAIIGAIGPDSGMASAALPLTIERQHRLGLKVSYRRRMDARTSVLTVETSEFSLALPGSRIHRGCTLQQAPGCAVPHSRT